MHNLLKQYIINQIKSEKVLKNLGFQRYNRRPRISMCRNLPIWEIPKEIKTQWGERQHAHVPGYIAVYDPGDDDTNTALHCMTHWFVERSVFARTYTMWDGDDSALNDVQRNLLNQGCLPFFKHAGVWAVEIDEPGCRIRGLEATPEDDPTPVPVGVMLMIGADGEPYFTDKEKFSELYEL